MLSATKQDLRQHEADKLKDEFELEKATSTSSASKDTNGRKIVFDTVIDQAGKTEVQVLSEVDIAALYKRDSDARDLAHADEKPTRGQLTAPITLSQRVPLYCDVAVYGPNANRLGRKLAFSGLVVAEDGSMLRTILPARWMATCRTFRVASIMLDIVFRRALDLYSDHIQRFATASGPELWLPLYQSDVRLKWDLIRGTGSGNGESLKQHSS